MSEIRLPQRLETRRVDQLIPYARNARTHSDAQVAQIAASIREFGWTNPVLINGQDGIIAGHGRVLAAYKLKMDIIPVIVLTGLTAAQQQALVIADNKLALNAGWDVEALTVEIKDLNVQGYDLALLGFDETELEAIFAPPIGGTGKDGDKAPIGPPANPASRPGDLWILGNRHRLICGDSRDAHTVERLLGDSKPHLMVTDPPYGVEYDANWRNEAARTGGLKSGNHRRPIGGTSIGKVENDDKADWRDAWALFPGDVAYVWCASLHIHEVADSLLASDFKLRASIIWRKQIHVIGRGDYHWQHEPCWYAVRKGKTGHWQGDRTQSTVWDIANKTGASKGGKGDEMQTGHSTQKPVECMARPIRNNSSVGQTVYDPFCGSGTTLIACEMERRLGFAVELEPAYVDVAIQRWQQFTGDKALLDGDGRSFDEVVAAGPRDLSPVEGELAAELPDAA